VIGVAVQSGRNSAQTQAAGRGKATARAQAQATATAAMATMRAAVATTARAQATATAVVATARAAAVATARAPAPSPSRVPATARSALATARAEATATSRSALASARAQATARTPTATPTLLPDATMGAVDGAVYVYVPAGEFVMGSASTDPEADDDERPPHTVYLDAYWIGQTEVTNAQYAQCEQAGLCRPPARTGSSTRGYYYGNARYDHYPVISVSWSDAETYCRWAGGRLPTEAEWEKAARGTDGRVYPWGNALTTSDLLNFDDSGGDTTAVGSYPAGASPYGTLDMAGNVWEWVADWYGRSYYGESPEENPAGPASGAYRVLRGGSWGDATHNVRAANRLAYDPGLARHMVGFRCAR